MIARRRAREACSRLYRRVPSWKPLEAVMQGRSRITIDNAAGAVTYRGWLAVPESNGPGGEPSEENTG